MTEAETIVFVGKVLVIGGGQAGLSVSRGLSRRGIAHVVLERDRVASSWRSRWDSFTLVTPNWTLGLPGSPYAGDDPDGHVPREEIVDHLQAYAKRWHVPVREGVAVERLSHGTRARFRLTTSAGPMDADIVVVCTGAFQRPFRPPAGVWPSQLAVLDAVDYRNPAQVPDGKVLIIGSGQTGVQFAEELHLAGREVFLSCGRAPWNPRRLDGIDTVTWAHRVRFFDQPLAALPSPAGRLLANPQATGAGGGHDLHYRTLQALGVTLLGRLEHVAGHRAHFVDDLATSVAFGDARWADLRQALREGLPARGYAVPHLPAPEPFHHRPVTDIDLHGFGAVIYTSGYRPDYRWIDYPVVDDLGYPITVDGASPAVPGLFFCGVHFMRIRRSGWLFGVGEDAEIVAGLVGSQVGTTVGR